MQGVVRGAPLVPGGATGGTAGEGAFAAGKGSGTGVGTGAGVGMVGSVSAMLAMVAGGANVSVCPGRSTSGTLGDGVGWDALICRERAV